MQKSVMSPFPVPVVSWIDTFQGVGPRRGVAADLHAVHGGDRVADRVPTAGGRDRDVDRQGTGVTLVGGNISDVPFSYSSFLTLGHTRSGLPPDLAPGQRLPELLHAVVAHVGAAVRHAGVVSTA